LTVGNIEAPVPPGLEINDPLLELELLELDEEPPVELPELPPSLEDVDPT